MDIDNILDTLQNHPLFLRLKNVIENGFEGEKVWHDNEPIFDHSVNTLYTAKGIIKGDFITSFKAKELFLQWINNDIHGEKQKDLSLIIALIHDCGKNSFL